MAIQCRPELVLFPSAWLFCSIALRRVLMFLCFAVCCAAYAGAWTTWATPGHGLIRTDKTCVKLICLYQVRVYSSKAYKWHPRRTDVSGGHYELFYHCALLGLWNVNARVYARRRRSRGGVRTPVDGIVNQKRNRAAAQTEAQLGIVGSSAYVFRHLRMAL